jgi:demethylmenaquinone methyltransferase/2-methoxy-6-polyprenyl-1,4-benzoquinol methylase
MSPNELPFIREMFDKIAPRYDFLNRTLSMKRDVAWRKEMVKSLGLRKGKESCVLDVACGTCDVALEAVKETGKKTRVFGLDFSLNMLVLGRRKISEAGVSGNIPLLAGNGLCLPFGASLFDAATIAFGIRNIADKEKALSEFERCLKPGGTLAVLELSTPENRFFQALYLFYFLKILPMVGGIFSKNRSAYEYLPESVLRFPRSEAFAALMEKAGFKEVAWKKMTFGIVTLYTGKKAGR